MILLTCTITTVQDIFGAPLVKVFLFFLLISELSEEEMLQIALKLSLEIT